MHIVIIPWSAILPQLPTTADLISNVLAAIPPFMENSIKLMEKDEFEMVYKSMYRFFIISFMERLKFYKDGLGTFYIQRTFSDKLFVFKIN